MIAVRETALRRGLLPALIVLFAVTLGPALFLVVTSLTPWTPTRPETALDFSDPAQNYVQAFTDARLRNSVVVQLKLSIATVVTQLAFGLGLALLLNSDDRLIRLMRTGFLIPMVLPPIVVAIIWKILYVPDTSPIQHLLALAGWQMRSAITDPVWALPAIVLAETWEWFPFTLLMSLAALQTLPKEPVEAAQIDGAGAWQVFRYVVFPWIQPTLLVVAIFRLIDSVKAFPLIYILTEGGPGTVTEVTNYYAFVQSFNFSYWGYGSAIATLLIAGVLVLCMVVQRLGRVRTAE